MSSDIFPKAMVYIGSKPNGSHGRPAQSLGRATACEERLIGDCKIV